MSVNDSRKAIHEEAPEAEDRLSSPCSPLQQGYALPTSWACRAGVLRAAVGRSTPEGGVTRIATGEAGAKRLRNPWIRPKLYLSPEGATQGP